LETGCKVEAFIFQITEGELDYDYNFRDVFSRSLFYKYSRTQHLLAGNNKHNFL